MAAVATLNIEMQLGCWWIPKYCGLICASCKNDSSITTDVRVGAKCNSHCKYYFPCRPIVCIFLRVLEFSHFNSSNEFSASI